MQHFHADQWAGAVLILHVSTWGFGTSSGSSDEELLPEAVGVGCRSSHTPLQQLLFKCSGSSGETVEMVVNRADHDVMWCQPRTQCFQTLSCSKKAAISFGSKQKHALCQASHCCAGFGHWLLPQHLLIILSGGDTDRLRMTSGIERVSSSCSLLEQNVLIDGTKPVEDTVGSSKIRVVLSY